MPLDPRREKSIREEFLNHPELAGDSGYYNPTFAEKIADWWLSKLSQEITKATEEMVKLIREEIGDRRSIKELINEGNMRPEYQVHPCDISYKDGWNLSNDRVLALPSLTPIKQDHE